MHPNTKKILEDLKNLGVDISTVETQLNTNVAADNFLGAGVTRQQEFNTIITEKRRIEAELAAAQNQSTRTGVPIDQNSLTALKTKLDSLKTFLIEEDYPADQVNNLFKDTEAILAAPQTQTPSASPNPNQGQQQRGKIMTDEERLALRNDSAAMGASLAVGLNLQIQKAYSEFHQLFGRLPTSQEIGQLESAMAERTLKTGEAVDAVAADIFKFSDKRNEIAATELKTQLDAARAEGRNEVLQQHPEIAIQKPRGARLAAPIAGHFAGNNKSGTTIPGVRVSAGAVQNSAPNSPPPANQQSQQPIINPNDPNAAFRDENGRLPFETRGDRNSRLLHVQAVAASKPELFDDYGYKPTYGSQDQQ